MAEMKNQETTSKIKKSKKVAKTREERLREKLIGEGSSFHIREAYKTLRTNITFSMAYEGCKKFIVTSSLASEGKSTNCLNLAITFVETGAKVCVVDCDLRRPNIHRLLDVPATPGLSNVLVNMNTAEEVVRHSVFQNLDFVSAGDIPPNPAELLGSDKFKEFIESIEKDYDYIIIDSCPVNVVTDTVIISKIIPDVVMVALQNSTEKEPLKDAIEQLEFVDAKILGFILNGVEYDYKGGYKYRYGRKYYRIGKRYKKSGYYRRSGYGGYGGYGYGYGYGYGQKTNSKKEKAETVNK